MSYFLITLAVLFLFLIFMAIGVLLGGKPLQGSCGGLGRIMGKDCELCENKDKCEKKNK